MLSRTDPVQERAAAVLSPTAFIDQRPQLKLERKSIRRLFGVALLFVAIYGFELKVCQLKVNINMVSGKNDCLVYGKNVYNSGSG